ncbi:MAG: tetraacyldisaccharide 4'-kinase [Prevotella sp.]|nr:tetraacyldisaccharide 4'-kinase [Prevotella sp.]
MEGNFIRLNKKLLPLSWLYGLVVKCRNMLFDMNILKSKSYSTPVIAVGNITVGGTGKTPHVEYLIRLLKDQFNVAMLSRGYKRKSSGYVLAATDTKMEKIGDEPYQIKQKYPKVTVAVDAKRTRGIEHLIHDNETKETDVILLDDAFQHRYVKPGVNILLVDYHRPIIFDKLLPAGRLREPLKGKSRADIVIVTKCPKDLKPMDFRVLTKQMNLYPYQQLFFTTLDYDRLKKVFPTAKDAQLSLEDLTDYHVLLLTGIASPKQIFYDVKPHAKSVKTLAYGDHHVFKHKDIHHINETFANMPSPKIIITTEKDMVRLETTEGLSDEVRNNLFVLPVRISFMLEGEATFNENIIGYVRKNSRNSILAKGKDDHKSEDSDSTGNRPRTISFRNN